LTRFFFHLPTDPPEITVESPVVYSGEGQEAMLVCIVHGEAQPEVSHTLQSHENSLTCCLVADGDGEKMEKLVKVTAKVKRL
jgi:hypothetical protein